MTLEELHSYYFQDRKNTAEEQHLLEALALLQESYAKAVKPYIDRLTEIRAVRQSEPMIVTVEQAQALGLLLDNKLA